MPLEILVETLRPQVDAPTVGRDRLKFVRMDPQLFSSIQDLCKAANGYYGLECSMTVHPDRRAESGMLISSLKRGLEMVGRGARGAPFDTFRQPEARKTVEGIITLAQLGLGLTFKRVAKVDRVLENRGPEPEPTPLPPGVAEAIYRR